MSNRETKIQIRADSKEAISSIEKFEQIIKKTSESIINNLKSIETVSTRSSKIFESAFGRLSSNRINQQTQALVKFRAELNRVADVMKKVNSQQDFKMVAGASAGTRGSRTAGAFDDRQLFRANQGINKLLQDQEKARLRAQQAAERSAERIRKAEERLLRSQENATRKREALAAREQKANERRAQSAERTAQRGSGGIGVGGAIGAGAVGGAIGAGLAIGGASIAGGLTQFAQLADQAILLEARLKLATKSQQEFNAAYQGTLRIAIDTRTSFAETVNLYGQLARATENLSLSQESLLKLTETVSKTATISGGGASAQAGLFQFQQALAGGVLRGEELNSVLEQTPALAKAIADGLGLPVSALRKLAEQGKLTTEVVLGAVERSGGRIDEQFQQFNTTIEGAFTNFKNKLLASVSQINGASDATSGFVSLINELGDVLTSEEVIGGLTTLTKLLGDVIRLGAGAVSVTGDFLQTSSTRINEAFGGDARDRSVEQQRIRLNEIRRERENRANAFRTGGAFGVVSYLQDNNSRRNIFDAALDPNADIGIRTNNQLAEEEALLSRNIEAKERKTKATQQETQAVNQLVQAQEKSAQIQREIAELQNRALSAKTDSEKSRAQADLDRRRAELALTQGRITLEQKLQQEKDIVLRSSEESRRLADIAIKQKEAELKLAIQNKEVLREQARQNGTLENFEKFGAGVGSDSEIKRIGAELEAARKKIEVINLEESEAIVQIDQQKEDQLKRQQERDQRQVQSTQNRAEREARIEEEKQSRILQLQLELNQQIEQNNLTLQETLAQNERQALEERFSAGLIGYEDYYNNIVRLEQEVANRKLKTLNNNKAQLEAELAVTTELEKQLQLKVRLEQVNGQIAEISAQVAGAMASISMQNSEATKQAQEQIQEAMFTTQRSMLEFEQARLGIGSERAQQQKEELERQQNLVRLEQVRAQIEEARRNGNNVLLAQLQAQEAQLMSSTQKVNEFGVMFEDSFSNSLTGFFESIGNGTKSVKDAFKDMFNNIAQQITAFVAKQLSQQIMGSLFGNGGAGSSAGGFLGNLLGGGGGGGGGIGGFFGSLFGGFRASGGPVFDNKAYVVGEKGPELFIPQSAGTVVSNQNMARQSGGGGVIINVTTPDANSFRKSTGQLSVETSNQFRRYTSRNG